MKIRFKTRPDIEYSLFHYRQSHQMESYRNYDLVDSITNYPDTLTNTIRIEEYRGKSDSRGIEYYFRLKDNEHWNKCSLITGLREVTRGTYYGDDCRSGKSQMFFYFANDDEFLVIAYLHSYFDNKPSHRDWLIKAIKKAIPKNGTALTDLKPQQWDLSGKGKLL